MDAVPLQLRVICVQCQEGQDCNARNTCSRRLLRGGCGNKRTTVTVPRRRGPKSNIGALGRASQSK